MGSLENLSVYDVTLRMIVCHHASVFISELTRDEVGGRLIRDRLNTEFSRIPKVIADFIARVADDEIIHVEFQSGNDAAMHWRMLEYYGEIARAYPSNGASGPLIHQYVVYVGRPRMSMAREIRRGNLAYSFELREIRTLGHIKPGLRASRHWGDRVLSLLCSPETHDDEWRATLKAGSRLPTETARRVVFWIWVFARLRPLATTTVREIEAMALQFDVSDDPVFRPAIDRAITSTMVDLVIDFFDEGELSLENDQIEELRLLSPDILRRILRGLPRNADPMSFLNAELGHSPPVPGE